MRTGGPIEGSCVGTFFLKFTLLYCAFHVLDSLVCCLHRPHLPFFFSHARRHPAETTKAATYWTTCSAEWSCTPTTWNNSSRSERPIIWKRNSAAKNYSINCCPSILIYAHSTHHHLCHSCPNNQPYPAQCVVYVARTGTLSPFLTLCCCCPRNDMT